MRKAAILLAVLLVFGVGGMLCAHASLSTSQYDVRFTESAAWGDASFADGLAVNIKAQLAQHLTWDSIYTFAPRRAQTDFSFSRTRLEWPSEARADALSLNMFSSFSASTSGGNLLGDDARAVLPEGYILLDKIFRDVASRTQNGERHSESIDLRDYFDCYPISASFWHRPYYYRVTEGGETYISQIANEREVSEVFSRYFSIPISPEHEMTVEICKDSVGNIAELSTTQAQPTWLSAVSADTERGIFFALQMGDTADYSGITGGFGIYLLPVATIMDFDGKPLPTLDYYSLSTVYPLDESVAVQRLDLSADGQALNLIAIENGALYLTVIDIATMTEKQKLLLLDNVIQDSWLWSVIYTDGLLFALLGDDRFALCETNGDGTYGVALLGERNGRLLNEDIYDLGYYRWYEPVISWNGERLAVATADARYVYYDDGRSPSFRHTSCGFVLEVFDESGLKYKGKYESSLDVLATQQNYYGRCYPIDTGALSLSWHSEPG